MRSLKAGLIRREPLRQALKLAAGFYDRWVCTVSNARIQAGRKVAARGPFRFSVGIPHYNRGSLIYRPLFNLLCHPAVGEIVIVDDGSEPAEFAALERTVAQLDAGERIRIHRRSRNLGALRTKLECVERAACEWVLILDCDNTAFNHYLDALAAQKPLDPHAFYCASWAFPCFPFHELGGRTIDFGAAADLTASKVLRRVYIMNDGNYLVHRESFIESTAPAGDVLSEAADVMLVNYRWLSRGGSLRVLPSTSYCHRVDGSSFWKRTQGESRELLLEMLSRFENKARWDASFDSSLKRAS